MTFPPKESHFLIDGPAGKLELLTLAVQEPTNKIAIICHPDPQQEGTMYNKVVTTVAKAFFEMGINTIRFNYRGVGQSEGSYGNTIGETQDLLAVIAWAKTVIDDPQFWLAGFSFGSYIAANGARTQPCQQVFSIAPSVNKHNFDSLQFDYPWVILVPEADEVASPQAAYDWYENNKHRFAKTKLIRIPECSHFFHGKLPLLKSIMKEEICK